MYMCIYICVKRIYIYTHNMYMYMLQNGFHPLEQRRERGRVKGADASTRVGKRRLCWRWIAAGGLEGVRARGGGGDGGG